jgi:hypothetical protein
MPTLLFQVFERDDFNNAKDGSLLSGYIKMEDSQAKQCGVVQLGQEVEDLSTRYLESTTEFRKFIRCKIGLSNTEDLARLRKAALLQEFFTVRIFY